MNNSYSSLYPEVGYNFPDDSFSTIPYEKGFQLLWYMQSLIGDELMQTMLQQYILENSQTSITYYIFKAKFESTVDANFNETMAAEIKGKMDWDAWVHQPGLAPVWQDFTTPALNESSALADQYIALAGQGSPQNYTDYNSWYSSLRQVFLQRFNSRLNDTTITILEKVDADLNVTNTLDPELKAIWYPMGIKLGWEHVMTPAYNFISSMGRMKYLSPIYGALLAAGKHEIAVQWFEDNIDFYHPYVVAKLKKMLGVSHVTKNVS